MQVIQHYTTTLHWSNIIKHVLDILLKLFVAWQYTIFRNLHFVIVDNILYTHITHSLRHISFTVITLALTILLEADMGLSVDLGY